MKHIRIAVYGVLITPDNKVLMTQTQSGSKKIFNFPGGAIDFGETLKEALRREIKEELTIDITIHELMHVTQGCYSNDDFPDSQMLHLYFKITPLKNHIIKKGDVLDIHYFPLDTMPFSHMLPIDIEFVKTIIPLEHQ